jgi:hypothetical protein
LGRRKAARQGGRAARTAGLERPAAAGVASERRPAAVASERRLGVVSEWAVLLPAGRAGV